MAAPTVKAARLEARITREQKRSIERAARIRGTSVSDFVIRSAQEAATRAIRETEMLVLTERSRRVFVNALLNPPAPNARARAAAKRYRREMGE